MSNYVKSVNFATKDALSPGDPLKAAKGTEVDTELNNIATAVGTKEDSANKNQPNGFAGLDGSSLISDAVHSTNIPRLNALNTWTGTTQTFSSTAPILSMKETDQGADAKMWRIEIFGSSFRIATRTDLDGGGVTALNMTRSGTTVTAIALISTALTWNGNTLFSTANDGAASGLDSDLLDGQQGSFYTSASNLSSGSLPDGRVAQSNVTQHQAALAISTSQLTTQVQTNVSSFSIAANMVEDIVVCNSASTINVTLNSGTHGAGDSTGFIRRGAGAVTFVAGGGQTVNTPGGLSIAMQHGKAVATYIATNTWELSGNI